MEKIILEFNGKPRKDDILYFDGEKWNVKNVKNIFADFQNQLNEKQKELEKMQAKLDFSLFKINKKLKSHHDAIEVLAREQ